MLRQLMLLIAAIVLAGCQTGQPTFDPFLGRTRIPPPGTGTIVPGGTQPYYEGAPPNGAPPPGAVNPSTTPIPGSAPYSTPPAGPYQYPAGQYNPQGFVPNRSDGSVARAEYQLQNGAIHLDAADISDSRAMVMDREVPEHAIINVSEAPIQIPADRQPVLIEKSNLLALAGERTADSPVAMRTSALEAPVTGTTFVPVRTTRTSRITIPNESLPANSVAAGEPRKFVPPQDAVDLSSLPVASQGRSDHAVQQATFVSRSSSAGTHDSFSASSSSQTPQIRYGYQADYRWLKGRLEHSQTTGQWKLRYIPIDGDTDRYGGSVVLHDVQKLSRFSAGEFVKIDGFVVASASGDMQSFAPVYRIDAIESLAD